MMKKILFILLSLSLFNNFVKAAEKEDEAYPRFTVGLEWGYVSTFFTAYHYNYFAPEGFRVDEHGTEYSYTSNADMYLNLGWNINHEWNLSLYAGYAGVGDIHSAIPISVRGTHNFGNDPLADRWFAFADVGSGICLKTPIQEIFTGKVGCGYQLSLSRDTKLNFLISARGTYTHPAVYYDDTRIPMSQTNRNTTIAGALSIGLGLVF